MKIEIAIQGPGYALTQLCREFDCGAPGVVYFKRGMAGPKPEIVLLESEKSMDEKLHAISQITRRLERVLALEGRFAFRVRNLAYVEPSAAMSREAFFPIPSMKIQPWNPTLIQAPVSGTVIIDAENAFGTGKHPSSCLCLQFLDGAARSRPSEGEGKGGDVLDFGCGTGLLAIAAVALGARKALGVEIDQQSVQTARKNVALNRLDHKIDIRQGSWKEVHGKFDLILANLVPSVLFRTGQNISNHLKDGGRAVIAGFGRNQMNDMERFFMDAGLFTQKKMTQDGWGLLVINVGKR